MPNEIELKLRISSADIPRLRRHPAILSAQTAQPVTRKLTSIYYDTPQLALLDAGISLRVRRMSGSWFQAVKAAGHAAAGLHQRMEWEDIIASGHPDFSKITEPYLTKIFDDPEMRAALSPIFSTEVRRTEWQLAWDNGDRLELALDTGELIAGDYREPIREIELELKGGRTERLFELALVLQQDLPLTIENVSKAQRGYARYRPQPPAIVRARRILLKKHMRAENALRHIGRECLNQLQGNQDMVLHGNDTEGIHQMRVALRRLRSSIDVFRGIIPPDERAVLRAEIRWIAGILGKARDLDVFILETLPPMLRHLHQHPGLLELRDRARTAQSQAHDDARDALGSQRYQRLLLTLGAWLERPSSDDHHPDAPDIQTVAQAMLTKHHKQLRRHGRQLARMHPEERHAARIAAKKLRYAAEFFASLYPGKGTRTFLRHLADLQAILGELNDIAVTESLIRDLAGNRPGKSLAESLQLFTGWNASDTMHRLEDMHSLWNSFADSKPFWH